jgi:4-amino-4-deoxy-L-arabinose transferase-like glycosyltransferase
MKTSLRDLLWSLLASLGLGLVLSLLGPGTWWIGWFAYTLILTLGLMALTALWRSASAPRSLFLMLMVAVILRLGLGIAFSTILPVYGNHSAINIAGYAVRDAYSYDTEAWKLASSGDPLWKAFDPTYKADNQYDDQYGGLLFLHSLVYRFLSPDARRPWLLDLFSALAGAMGVALAWKGARKSWGESTAWIVGWIMTLYPESLLTGGSPVRESFLILFTAMTFWGVVDWLTGRHRTAWVWLAGAIFGMLIFSPGVVVAALLVLGIWTWLREKERRISNWWFAGALVVIVLAALILGVVVGGTLRVPSGPLANLANWLKYTMNFGASETTLSSGWLQTIFETLPKPLHLPFIIAYGIAQPVLPAAIADPAVWPMRALGILRGLGWYALLPLLIYSLRSIWKIDNKRERYAWLWLWLASWIWIIISSARAGGDQWDNPRYRVILLLFQAMLAAQALTWQRLTRDRWLGRFLAVEGVFLALFGYWYISRYADIGLNVPNLFIIFAAIAVISAAILVSGWLLDRRRVKRRQKDSPR